MKIQFTALSALLMVSSVSALAAVPIPRAEVFNAISEQSRNLGYRGYDVMACLSGSGKLVAGGLRSWHTPLQIYLVTASNQVVSTRLISHDDDLRFSYAAANGNDVALNLGEGAHGGNIVTYARASLTVGAQGPQSVTCVLQNSGLE